MLMTILFMWAKDNATIAYKQGMNEILAIVCFAFFSERIETKRDFKEGIQAIANE